MEETGIKKRGLLGLFRGLTERVSSLFEKKGGKGGRHIALNSRFGHFLQNAEPGTETYELAAQVVMLCDEAASVTAQRLITLNKLKEIDEQLTDLECFDKMSDETVAHLKDLLERFVALDKDRNDLKYTLTGFDKALTTLEGLEDEATKVVEDVKDAETKQRFFRQDINYLQGEKLELEGEKESLVNSAEFIHKFTIGLFMIFLGSVAALFVLYFTKQINIFAPLAALTALVMVTVVMLLATRKRIATELRMNVLKQQKAVKMINRKNTVYAHYTNFLNFEYNKFKIRNADALKKNLKDYKNYKQLAKRMDSIRNIMSQTESEITNLLRENNINYVKTNLETFAKNLNIDEKRQVYHDLNYNKLQLESELSVLDKAQSMMWNKLTAYNTSDAAGVIKDIVNAYTEHVTSLMEKTEETKIDA